MGNIYDYFGFKPQEGKSYSISFVDDFLACSHRTFLSRLLRLGSNKITLPTFFGKTCHTALYEVILQMKEGRLPCNTCVHGCKMDSVMKGDVVKVASGECSVINGIRSVFTQAFTPSVVSDILQQADENDKLEKRAKELKRLQENGPKMVLDALIELPVGEVVLAEISLKGRLGEFPVSGNPDLLLRTDEGLELWDYKTRGSKPSRKDFPIRQLVLYSYLYEEIYREQIAKVGALYLVKSAAGAVYSDTIDRHTLGELYSNVAIQILTDIESISECIKHGLFTRNRRDTFCPCEFGGSLCENLPATKKAYEKQKELEFELSKKEAEKQGVTKSNV